VGDDEVDAMFIASISHVEGIQTFNAEYECAA
jgi:hypothetical protein